jgi:hypothetical protein
VVSKTHTTPVLQLSNSLYSEFIKWNIAEKIIFKETSGKNAFTTIKNFRDLDNIDIGPFIQSIISYLNNASSFHSDFPSNNFLPFQSDEYEMLFSSTDNWTEMLAVKIFDTNFNLELINVTNIILMCNSCKNQSINIFSQLINNYNIISVPSDESSSNYYLFNRINSTNFNFIRVQFDSISNKALKISLLFKDDNSNTIQCYSKECIDQNEGLDIPHFDVY